MYQSGRAGDEAKKRKSPAKSGRVGIYGSVSDWSCCKGNLLNSTKHEHYLVMVSDMSSISR